MAFTARYSTNGSSNDISSASGFNTSQVEEPGWKPSSLLKNSLFVLYTLICIFGVTGNVVVCYVIGIRKKRKRRFDILLVSLAVADLLALLTGSVTMVGDLLGDLNYWHFGAFMCKLLPSVSPITLFASSWTLAVISFDRYRIMRRRNTRKLRKRIMALQLAIVWIVAIAVTMPYIIGSKFNNCRCYTVAIFANEEWVAYVGFWIVTGWGVPLLMVAFLCCLILRTLDNGLAKGCHSSILERRLRRNKEILSMFILIVCAFFLLTTPYAAFYFSATYLMYLRPQSIDLRLVQQLNYALFMLMMTNSSINPIIYAKLHKEINSFAVKHWKRLADRFSDVCCRVACCNTNVFEMPVENLGMESRSSIL